MLRLHEVSQECSKKFRLAVIDDVDEGLRWLKELDEIFQEGKTWLVEIEDLQTEKKLDKSSRIERLSSHHFGWFIFVNYSFHNPLLPCITIIFLWNLLQNLVDSDSSFMK